MSFPWPHVWKHGDVSVLPTKSGWASPKQEWDQREVREGMGRARGPKGGTGSQRIRRERSDVSSLGDGYWGQDAPGLRPSHFRCPGATLHVLRMQILRNVGCHALFFPTADIHITGPGPSQVASVWERRQWKPNSIGHFCFSISTPIKTPFRQGGVRIYAVVIGYPRNLSREPGHPLLFPQLNQSEW